MYESMSTAVVLMIVRGVVFLILVVRAHFFITLCNPLAAPDSRVVVYVGYLVYHIPTMVHIVSVLSDGPDPRYISRVVGSWMQSIQLQCGPSGLQDFGGEVPIVGFVVGFYGGVRSHRNATSIVVLGLGSLLQSDPGAEETIEIGVDCEYVVNCGLVGGQLFLQVVTIPVGDLVLEFVDLKDSLHSQVQAFEKMANLLDARLLFGVDFVAFCLMPTQGADCPFVLASGVALLADDAVAVKDVAATHLIAGLAQVFRDPVLGLAHGALPDNSIFSPNEWDNIQYRQMDENIDLSKIQSIPHHEMLAITNQYMIGCVDHINKVADFAEKQMMDIDSLIDNLDNQVLILEAKLGINQQAKPDQ